MRRFSVLLPVAVAAAIVAFLLRRMRGGADTGAVEAFETSSRTPNENAGAPPSDEPATETVEHSYTCDGCQTEYRVSGEGRHTVYWKADSSVSDPVLDGACVECGKPLPGHHPVEDRTADEAEEQTQTSETEAS